MRRPCPKYAIPFVFALMSLLSALLAVSAASAFTIDVVRFEPHTDGVRLGWIVTPDSPTLTVTVQRADSLGVTWSDLRTGLGNDVWFDTSTQPDHAYRYRLFVRDGAAVDSTADMPTRTLAPPSFVSLTQHPGEVHVVWASTPQLKSYGFDREIATGIWQPVLPVFPDGSGLLHVDYLDYLLASDVRLRLTWVENDGVQRAGTPVLAPAMTTDVVALGSTFGAHRVTLHWKTLQPDTTLQYVITRSDRFHRAQFITSVKASRVDSTFSCTDTTVAPGAEQAYVVDARGFASGSDHGLIHGYTLPAPGAAIAHVFADRIELDWAVGIARNWPVRIERRDAGGVWSTLRDTVLNSVLFEDLTLHLVDSTTTLEQGYEYRLRWIEDATEAHSPAVAARRVAPVARLDRIESLPGRVRMHWRVAPTDTAFHRFLLRRPAATAAWDTLGRLVQVSGDDWFFQDLTAQDHVPYVYRVAWQPVGDAGHGEDYATYVSSPDYALAGPAPAPVHGAFWLAVTLPVGAPVDLQIVDVSGRQRFARHYDTPGSFVAQFAAGLLEPGVYFARLSSLLGERTRRFVVLP